MPKKLSEYSFQDFLHLRPLTHSLKTRRYKRMDGEYLGLPIGEAETQAARAAVRGRNVLITVAFEDPQAIEMQIALVRRYVTHDCHLIVDNSRTEQASQPIREAAVVAGVRYLKLPNNPWTKRNESRSHGLAMNWIWRNILKPGRPKGFGFIDHDLFPTMSVDPFAPLANHAFYGDLRWAGERWFLWAGYCFFDFEAVQDKPLDFGLDWFIGLDTGGANWPVLYHDLDPRTLPHRPIEPIEALPGVPLDEAKFERRNEWIHEVGWGTFPQHRKPKREALTALLRPYLTDGA